MISDDETAGTRLRLRGVESRQRLISWRQALGGERKVFRHANFNSSLRNHFVGMAVGIDGNSGQSLCIYQFRHACGQASGAFSEAGYGILQMLDIFIDAERAQVVNRALLNQFVLSVLVAGRPQHPSRVVIAGMRRHLCGENLQERMSVWHERSTRESLRGSLVILEVGVIDEAQIVVEPPVVGIVLDAVIHQIYRALRLARAEWRFGGKKAAAKFVSNHQMGIEVRRDFEQRRQQFVAGGGETMPVAEVLDGASPVNAGHQAVVTEAGALDYFGRIEEKDFVERSLRTKVVDAMKHKRACGQRQHQTGAGDDRNLFAMLHFRAIFRSIYFRSYFKSRFSKISTAPLRAMMA